MTIRRQRLWFLAVAATGLFALTVFDAAAAGEDLQIREVELEEDGSSRIVFSVPATLGALDDGRVQLTEDGSSVPDLQVAVLESGTQQVPVTLVVAIDVSGSTAGDALAATKQAAEGLVASATSRGVEVALLAFADEARLLVEPTTDVAALGAAIAGLEAGGDTALNDAVLLAARTLVGVDGDRRLLLFTDGSDDGSATDLATAVDAVRVAGLPVSSVLLQTAATDLAALEALATASQGTVTPVDTAADLVSAFDRVVEQLPVVHEVRWRSAKAGGDLTLRLSVSDGTSLLVDQALVVNPRQRVATTPRVVSPGGGSGILGAAAALPVGLALLGVGLTGGLFVVLRPSVDRETRRALELAEGAEPARAEAPRASVADTDAAVASLRARLTSRAADALEGVSQAPARDERLGLRLEQAGWALRPAELQVIRLGAAVLGFVMVAGLTQRLPFAGIAAVVGFLLPGMLADRAHAKRQEAFVDQMPDVLQLLAGSLRAGYGLVQAIDLVVQESTEPISSEFRRVINEHLLGLELEDALHAMAKRIDNEDLGWIVVAMNIQRRVGGNLAELFDIVSNTLRERAQVRRHVSALSAEGRLSARILTGMPFLIGGYVGIVNPDYLGELFVDPRGQVMLVMALVALGVGALWMRRLVDIDV